LRRKCSRIRLCIGRSCGCQEHIIGMRGGKLHMPASSRPLDNRMTLIAPYPSILMGNIYHRSYSCVFRALGPDWMRWSFTIAAYLVSTFPTAKVVLCILHGRGRDPCRALRSGAVQTITVWHLVFGKFCLVYVALGASEGGVNDLYRDFVEAAFWWE